jgi:serine/threonine protein kinase
VPSGVEPGDERFSFLVLMLQNKYFGPFPEKFFQLLDDEGAEVLRYVSNECGRDTDLFSKAGPETISPEDKDFICYLLRPDPRDRPSPSEALTHPWLKGV